MTRHNILFKFDELEIVHFKNYELELELVHVLNLNLN